jgi:putative resolvase
MGLGSEDMPTIGYARVSSRDQKSDLVRQQELLEAFCAAKGWRHEIIADLGCGRNYQSLLELILHKRIRRLVLTHQDRRLRFGSELVFALCAISNIEIIIINKGEPLRFEQELAQDVIAISTVFSARLYGSRSHKTKRLFNELTGETNDDEGSAEQPPIITKSMKPEDVEDEAAPRFAGSDATDAVARDVALRQNFCERAIGQAHEGATNLTIN